MPPIDGRPVAPKVGVLWGMILLVLLPSLSTSNFVARGGVEPPTFRFSVGRSYQLSYLAMWAERGPQCIAATQTGLEPATFALTGRRANQLRHWALLLRAPNGIRTRAAALKGRSPRPLDDGDLVVQTCPRRLPVVSNASIGHPRIL